MARDIHYRLASPRLDWQGRGSSSSYREAMFPSYARKAATVAKASTALKARRADAHDLASTPVPNQYRSQLVDPYCDQPVPDYVVLVAPRSDSRVVPESARYAMGASPNKRHAPTLAVVAGVIGLISGALVGIYGLLLFALVTIENDLGSPDRSFYQGSDASYVLLGLLDLALAACLTAGAVGLMSAKVTGRIALTIAGWVTAGLSFFWWDEGRAPWLVPAVMGASAIAMLLFAYHRTVTDWLGVLPVPQPE